MIGLTGISACDFASAQNDHNYAHTHAHPHSHVRANENCEQDDDSIGSEAFLSMHLGGLPKEDEKDLIVQNHAIMPHAPESGIQTGETRACCPKSETFLLHTFNPH
jgi:hypothetical protein